MTIRNRPPPSSTTLGSQSAVCCLTVPVLLQTSLTLDLATDGARHSLRRVHISEEALRVLLNLLDVEAEALVLASGRVNNTGNETVLGALDAANAAAHTLLDLNRVGESDARRASLALDRFVDVGRGRGGRLVVAAEVVESDVVAEDVLVAVQAELVQAGSAFEAAGVGVVGVDDLIGSGIDGVGGGELEGAFFLGDFWEMS